MLGVFGAMLAFGVCDGNWQIPIKVSHEESGSKIRVTVTEA
jgi:hypothetical protein